MSIRSTLVILSFLPLAASAAKTFDSTGLSNKKQEDKKVESLQETQKARKADKSRRFTPDIDQKGDLKKIQTQIKAINLIIKTETDRQKKIDLFIRRSQLYISAARTIGLKRKRLADMTAAEKKYLDSSQKTLSDLVKFSKEKPTRLANIYYLLGMIEYEYERYDKVRDYFIMSIRLDMKNPLATTMSLMIGELDYDKDRYHEAIKGYQWLYKQMNPREKALADYKTAWSYIGLTNLENAKKFLLRVIRVNGEPSFVEDSLRDLAFLVAQKDSEQETIRFGIQQFPNHQQRAKFYYHSLVYFLHKDKKKSRHPLFMEILTVEKDPLQRARILALKVSYERKEFPTVEAFKAMVEIDNHLKKMDPALKEKFFFQEGPVLEDNSEAIIKNFVDAYTGKLTMPDRLNKDYIITAMKKLIEIHVRLFPNSPKQDLIYSLWMDACFDSKDVPCLTTLKPLFKQKAETNKAFATLYTLSAIKLLTLFDQSYEKDPQTNETPLLTLIQEFIKEHPDHPENTKLVRKMTAVMLKKEQYNEALPFLEMQHKLENSPDSLHKLLFARFKLGMYKEVVEHPGVEKSKDPEVMGVYREASLILAQKSLEGDNFDAYEANLKKFLASSPDEKKAIVAYLDYFDRLLKAQKYDMFMKEWRSLSPTMKGKKDFVNIRAAALGGMMSDGYFVDDQHLQKPTDDPNLNFNIIVYQRALNKPLTDQEFSKIRKLPVEKRNYLYNLVLVTSPQLVIGYLQDLKRLDDDEKRILFTAYLFARGHDNFIFSDKQLKHLKGIVPKKMLPSEKTKLMGEFGKVKPPKPGINANKYNQQVEALVNHTRAIRKKIPKEIGKISTADKIELLSRAIELEKATAEAIKNSPVPPGLEEAQVIEYQNGVAEIAKEFENQAEEFVKSKTEIDVKNQVEEEDIEKQRLPQVQVSQLPMPSSSSRFNVAEELFKKAPIAALIFWDSQFSTKKIDAEDYYEGRSRLLLQIANHQPMRDFIAGELRAGQQMDLFNKWKGLVK